MSATERVLTDPVLVLRILKTLSSMKYNVKRQFDLEGPADWLEVRPTLVPSILVSRLWANEGTSVLWENYPHLLAMADMEPERKQFYANKVRKIFTISPPLGSPFTLEHLRDVKWPLLESLEMEVDIARHGDQIKSMLGPNLKHLEISGYQSEGAMFFSRFVLPTIFGRCTSLRSITFGPGPVEPRDQLSASRLEDNIFTVPSITSISMRTPRFVNTTPLFRSLSTYRNLSSVEIELDPGISLVPFLFHHHGPLFTSLTSLSIMLYPEVALALLPHLHVLARLHMDICRAPDHPSHESDSEFLDTILAALTHTPHLHTLTISIGPLSSTHPSPTHPLKLSGAALADLPTHCPALRNLSISAADPGIIDGSALSHFAFETFCAALPSLDLLELKLHPPTTLHFSTRLLPSLGHCTHLTTLRIGTILDPYLLSQSPVFHNLAELGFTPPEFNPEGEEPTEEEDAYIRSFASALEEHFPKLEVLECWGEGEVDVERWAEPWDNTLGRG